MLTKNLIQTFACIALSIVTTAVFAAPPAASSSSDSNPKPSVICSTCGGGGGGGGSGGSQSVTVTYAHADTTNHIATTKLDNGVVIQVDIAHGNVYVTYQGTTQTLALNSVLLEATDNDAQAANQLYAKLQSVLGSSSPNTIVGLPGAYSTNSLTTYGVISPGTANTSMPSGPGACDPIPNPCDGTDDEGFGGNDYDYWWHAQTGGSGPGTGGGPADIPDCDPYDQACQDYENRRQQACQTAEYLGMIAVGATIGQAGACFSPTVLTPPGAATCAGATIVNIFSNMLAAKNVKACLTPYPGGSQ